MSDGTWDIEYDRADDLKEEVKQYCKENGLEYPKFKNHMMMRDVESIFENLKLTKIKNCSNCRYNYFDLKLPCGFCDEYNQWKPEYRKD